MRREQRLEGQNPAQKPPNAQNCVWKMSYQTVSWTVKEEIVL